MRSISITISCIICCLPHLETDCWAQGDDLVVLGESLQVSAVSPGSVDPACVQDLKETARRSWNEYTARLNGIELDVTFSVVSLEEETPEPLSWTVALAPNGQQRLAVNESETSLNSLNERYAFSITRTNSSRPYVLEKVEPCNGTQLLLGMLSRTNDTLLAPVSIWWIPLEFIFDNLGTQKFKIVRAEYVQISDERTVQLAFEYQGKKVGKPFCDPDALYWAELLPDEGWLVRRSGLEGVENGPEKLRIVTSTTFHDLGDRTFVPAHVTLVYEDVREKIVEIRVADFSQPRPSERGAAEFYLPFYGISEDGLNLEPRRFGPVRIILALVAILGMLLAIFMYRRGRPRSSTS